MNTIKQLAVNVATKIKYEIPKEGSFLAVWTYREIPYSGTYQWRNGELAVFVDGVGWEIAGAGLAEDYYTFEQLVEMANGNNHGGASYFVAVVVVEVEPA
jgi:hypothetical protein